MMVFVIKTHRGVNMPRRFFELTIDADDTEEGGIHSHDHYDVKDSHECLVTILVLEDCIKHIKEDFMKSQCISTGYLNKEDLV